MNDHIEPTTQAPELPPEVFAELLAEARRVTGNPADSAGRTIELARLSYAAGADAELEACREFVLRNGLFSLASRLHATRRPKPQSLKEQALKAFEELIRHGPTHADFTAIRRALESLPDAD